MNNVKNINQSQPSPRPKRRSAPRIDERLLALSKRYRIAKYVTLLALVVFIIGMLSANRDELTIENIRYLLRYLNADATVYSYSSEYKTISYNADSEITFDIYRGDFVVADSTSVNIYASSGSNVLSASSYISNPVILTSGNYLMVYDLGGNSYAIYNTFSKIFGESLDYPITGGAYSDSGMYALITKTAEYRSAVFVYNKNNTLVTRILKDKNKLVMDVDINSASNEILMASAYTMDGDFNSEVMICDPYSSEPKMTLTESDLMPLKAKYNSDGFYVLCDTALLFYGSDGTLRSRFDYGSKVPVGCVMSDSHVFLIFSESVIGNGHSVCIFDTNGSEVGRKRFDGQFVKLISNDSDVYVLTNRSIIRMMLDGAGESVYNIEGNSIGMCLARSDTLYLCYQGYASAIDIESVLPYSESLSVETTAVTTAETAPITTSVQTEPIETASDTAAAETTAVEPDVTTDETNETADSAATVTETVETDVEN